MTRLVAVSNRVAVPKGGRTAGGLAVGVMTAFERHGGLWFGWSGKTTEGDPGEAKVTSGGRIRYATIDINEQAYDDYYNGFSNETLWPLFHFMLGFFSFSRSQFDAYRRVNQLFAARLLPLLQADDIVWVHDYHLIPLAADLRRAGIDVPIGFFLHVPFPNFNLLRALPCCEDILRWLASYDVVGFQTERDLTSFHECMTQPEIGGELLRDGRIRAYGRVFTAGVFPIGIEVDQCQSLAVENVDRPQIRRLAKSLLDRMLIIGVDRLDYSKGLVLRFGAFECLLTNYPEMRGRVVFMQIAPPTRPDIRTYEEIRHELEQAAGNINGRFAEMDWMPIRYLNRAYGRGVLMTLMRSSGVGLVTPIRDGMNLVAKEYVASQDPENPGVLVLSRLSGAAIELAEGAVLVNPYDKDGAADGLRQAIDMPLEERRERHAAMMAVLRRNDIHSWAGRFVEALQSVRSGSSPLRTDAG